MARCQVCDGPVVNGRCKLCGMPYKNDEVLYHLNESRSDHYKHATSRARQEMRTEQIPLPDRKTAAKPPAKKQSAKRQSVKKQKNDRQGSEGGSGIAWIIILILILLNWFL